MNYVPEINIINICFLFFRGSHIDTCVNTAQQQGHISPPRQCMIHWLLNNPRHERLNCSRRVFMFKHHLVRKCILLHFKTRGALYGRRVTL